MCITIYLYISYFLLFVFFYPCYLEMCFLTSKYVRIFWLSFLLISSSMQCTLVIYSVSFFCDIWDFLSLKLTNPPKEKIISKPWLTAPLHPSPSLIFIFNFSCPDFYFVRILKNSSQCVMFTLFKSFSFSQQAIYLIHFIHYLVLIVCKRIINALWGNTFLNI